MLHVACARYTDIECLIFCAEGKKSKLTKSPCVGGGSDATTRERPEPVGRQSAAGEKREEGKGEEDRRAGEVGGKGEGDKGEGGKGEGEGREEGGGRGDGDGERDGVGGGMEEGGGRTKGKGEVGRGEEGEDTQGEEEDSQDGTICAAIVNDTKAMENAVATEPTPSATTDEALSAVVNGDVVDEGDVPPISRDDGVTVGSPCTSQSKVETDESPVPQPSLSPPPPHPAAAGGAEEGGEEGMVVVMSEEEEGPLDSSMEEFPSLPTPVRPAVVDAEGMYDTLWHLFLCV